MKRLNQSGSHILMAVVLLVVLGAVGATGYKVQQSHDNKTKVASKTTTPTNSAVPSTVSNAADLQIVSQTLDQSSSQLSSGLDDSQLNADLNSML